MNARRHAREGALLAALAATLPAAPVLAQAGAGRVRPPAELSCPRDLLTLYAGQVQRYQRGKDHTRLVIRTDWDTTETVTLAHPGSDDPAAWFMIDGQAFTAPDWARIESRPGHLRPGMRVSAWVCKDGRNATLDWAPPRPP